MKETTEQFALLLFPFFVVFVFIPTELYYHNSVHWNDTFLLFFIATTGLLVGFLTGILVMHVSKTSTSSRSKIAFWFFLIGIYFLLADVYTPVQLSQLDGSDLKSDQPLLFTVVEIAFLIGVALVGIFLNRTESYKYGLFLSQLGIIAISSYFLFAVIATPGKDKAKPDDPSSSLVERQTDLPNVYHIVLDAMQTDYFLEALTKGGYINALDGFTIFRKNVSNYPYTQSSSASYFSGTRYTGGDFSQWIEETDFWLLNIAKAAGYELTVYASPSVITAAQADKYITSDEVFLRYAGTSHPRLKEFIRLWTARVLPNAFTNKALEIGEILGDRALRLFSNMPTNVPMTINDGVEPFTATYMFRDATNSEMDRPNIGSYLYLHVLLPHEPFVLNSECEYSELQGDVANRYMQQVDCAVRLLTNFLNELKREGKYEDAMIIVHGDHGNGWAGFLQGVDENGEYVSSINFNDPTPYRQEIHSWSKHQLESRSMALLMIKPPGAQGEFAISDATTQLLDLYPTVLDSLGISPPTPTEGLSLISCVNDSKNCDLINQRQRFFYYFTVGVSRTKDVEELLIGSNELGQPEFLSSHFKRTLYPVTLGDTISFSNDGRGSNYLKAGWSGQEESYVWTNGNHSNISFSVPSSGGRNLLFRLNAFPFLGGGLSHQTVDVHVNGQVAATWQISEPGWYEATIPASAIADEKVEIDLTISNPTAPCKVGNSTDCRELGIAVMKMEVRIRDN